LNKFKNKVCLVTFFYPGAKKYVSKFSKCINSQTFKDFDLILICNNTNIDKAYLKIDQNIKKIFIKGNINTVRLKTILFLKNFHYSKIVFHDIDDACSSNRIQISVDLLKKNSVVFNDIHCIKKKIIKKNFFSIFFSNYEKVNYKKIVKQNFIGFTNSAVNKKVLKKINFPNQVPNDLVFDWYLWSRILFHYKAIFTNKCISYYNVNRNSITNLPINMSKKYVKEVIKVKKIFYNYMKKYDKIYRYELLKLENHKKNVISSKKTNFSWWGINEN